MAGNSTDTKAVAQPQGENVSHLTTVRGAASLARPRRRHAGLFATFLAFVFLPTLAGILYLWLYVHDQFESTVGFSVHKEEMSSPIELLGGVSEIGSFGGSDSDTLFAYITSQEMVEKVDARLDLRALFDAPGFDPLFTVEPDASIEDLVNFWQRMVQVDYDSSTELLQVRALAFRAADARALNVAIFEESARLITELSGIARTDAISFAESELQRAVDRLKDASEHMTEFRSRTQIVDPSADVMGQMTLLGELESQLAQAMIEADLLRESTRSNDVRVEQADRRIAVIEGRIDDERQKLGRGERRREDGDDYADLLGQYERLAVEQRFAEESYVAALASYDVALADARRKSRYLAAHIKPTLAQTSEHPQRFVLAGAFGLFLLLLWSIGVLIYYSIRDR